MKKIWGVLLAGTVGIWAGCATPPVAVNEPVGPDPFIAANGSSNGRLRVYTAAAQQNDVGFQTAYYQRTPYIIYDSNGSEIRRVDDNDRSYFLALPRTEDLPAGTYKINAWANVGFGERVMIPVVVEAGRTTEVHLNGNWRPPADVQGHELVRAPAGFPIGWKATSQGQ